MDQILRRVLCGVVLALVIVTAVYAQPSLDVITPDNAPNLQLVRTLGEQQGVLAVRYSGQGTYLGVASFTGLRLYDGDLTRVMTVADDLTVSDFAFSQDEQVLALGIAQVGQVQVWQMPDQQMPDQQMIAAHTLPTDSVIDARLVAVDMHPDGDLLAAGSETGRVELYDFTTDTVRATLQTTPIQTGDGLTLPGKIRFSADGALLAVVEQDQLSLWDWADEARVAHLPFTEAPLDFAWQPDGAHLAVLTTSGEIVLWNWQTDAQTTHPVTTLNSPYDAPLSLAFSADGDSLIVQRYEGIDLWDVTADDALYQTTPVTDTQDRSLSAIASHPTRRAFAYVYQNGSYGLFDLDQMQLDEVHRSNGGIESLSFSPTGQTLYIGERYNWLRAMDVETGAITAQIRTDYAAGALFSYGVDAQGHPIVAYNNGGGGNLWTPDTDTFTDLGPEVWVVAFNPADPTLRAVVNAPGDRVEIQDAAGEVRLTLDENPGVVTALNMDSAGRLLAAGDTEGHVVVWDVEQGTVLQHLVTTGSVAHVIFDPAGRLVAAGDANGILRVWDVASGEQVFQFDRHEDMPLPADGLRVIHSFAFNPDGTLLAALGNSGAHVWRVSDFAERWQHETSLLLPFSGLDFSPDGTLLAIGSTDSRVYLFGVDTP